MSDVLVLYCTRDGATEALAREICRGVDSVAGMASRLRTVPPVSTVAEAVAADIPDDGPPYATPSDLATCAGLVIGSPTRFGNMDAALKYFIDNTVGEWLGGADNLAERCDRQVDTFARTALVGLGHGIPTAP